MARIESELESDLGPAWIWQPFGVGRELGCRRQQYRESTAEADPVIAPALGDLLVPRTQGYA